MVFNISFDKFKSLDGKTFFKKSSLLISQDIATHIKLDDKFINEIIIKLRTHFPNDSKTIVSIEKRIKNESLLVLKDFIDSKFGKINADLDFIDDNKDIDKSSRIIKKRYLVLDDIRSPYNLGSIIRSAESFFIKEVIVLSEHLTTNHPNTIRSACRTLGLMECKLFKKRQEGIEYIKSLKLPIFSLECSDNNISSFKFFISF